MVYCGKPSKGCSNCRLRRIKCDQKDPSCSQCLRAGKSCPGYRDPLMLMFRDENAKVVRRVHPSGNSLEIDKALQKAESSAKLSKSTRATISPRHAQNCNSLTATPTSEFQCTFSEPLLLGLDMPDSECNGLAFFFTHYVSVSAPFGAENIDRRTSPFWVNLHRNKHFFDAISSVGLAGLSNVTNDKSLMVAANRKHAASLSHVAGALKDLNNADLEETLMEVMLLAIFEIVDWDGQAFRKPGVHLEGVAALLRAITQNKKQTQVVPAIRMQLQLCFIVLIRYFEIRKSLPSEIAETIQHCGDAQREADLPASSLVLIVGRFIELHARISRSELSDPETIIQSALFCESELEQWELHLPAKWKPETVISAEPILYNGQYHAYRDLWTARIWGHYRWARVLVNELLLAHIAKLKWHTLEHGLQRARSLHTISRTASDICTSLPSQFLCHHSLAHGCTGPVPHMTGVFLVLFPLAVAGAGSGVPDDLHRWVINMLGYIGHTMGVRQALALITTMEMRREAARMLGPGWW